MTLVVATRLPISCLYPLFSPPPFPSQYSIFGVYGNMDLVELTISVVRGDEVMVRQHVILIVLSCLVDL
jgi:hypothetical protein